jgi:hypothetical protein
MSIYSYQISILLNSQLRIFLKIFLECKAIGDSISA